MKIRRLCLLIPVLAFSACGDTGTTVDTIASITLTPPSPSIDVGLSVQFEAQARDAGGIVVPNATFTWATSNSSVASITTDGLATALTVGTAAITASAGGASASEVLIVEPSQCAGRVDVILSAGQFQSYAGDTCLFLPSGLNGDRYRVAVSRPTLISDPDDVPAVALEINPIFSTAQVAGVEPVPALAEPLSYSDGPAFAEGMQLLDGTRFLEDAAVKERTRRFHMELREREEALGLRTSGVLPSRPFLASGPVLADPPARADLFLGLTCDQVATSPVALVAFNDDLVIYQDSVQGMTAAVSPASSARMLAFYSDYVRDLMPQYWGDTPDTDGNGRIILTTSPLLPDSAAAGVFSGDFRSTANCAGSNQGEVMYFDNEVINNMDDPTDPSFLALSVMAHELKHITSLYHSVRRAPPQFHNLWIEEGTAEIAQTMASRVAWAAIGGPAVGSVLDAADISDWNTANQGIAPEMWGIVGQIADVIVALSTQPNSLITNPAGASSFHTFYASSWHWHRFIGDAYGNASTPLADGQLFKEMTDSLTPSGPAALAQVTGRTFDQLYEDLIVAMSLHRTSQPEPTRAFSTWDLVDVTAIFANPPDVAPPHSYPWPITTNLAGSSTVGFTAAVYSCPLKLVGTGDARAYQPPAATDRCGIGPSGVRFHDFVSSGAGAGAQIVVTGAPTGRITVTRLR
ncbi:MAG: Ig-like domain-containing protein [Gemmatimonadetes bacterium]|nr:Ig-like domain-containing protein [Gemmatimonadota bacterium]